jgi:hypothetical protein
VSFTLLVHSNGVSAINIISKWKHLKVL